jgi:prepilin-type N-terminal cleavage/methylation domain-containing protein
MLASVRRLGAAQDGFTLAEMLVVLAILLERCLTGAIVLFAAGYSPSGTGPNAGAAARAARARQAPPRIHC